MRRPKARVITLEHPRLTAARKMFYFIGLSAALIAGAQLVSSLLG